MYQQEIVFDHTVACLFIKKIKKYPTERDELAFRKMSEINRPMGKHQKNVKN